jgi:molecular chaperone HtpG
LNLAGILDILNRVDRPTRNLRPGALVDYQFKINLRGIIDLLSNHLYSGPEVYVRELLQNGVDAIRARQKREPGHRGEVRIEILKRRGKTSPILALIDNGVGLTEEEVHKFLATIGMSSKSGEFWERPEDFIGRFGIGLLSCFIVSDEIAVITRSIVEGSPAIEWRGRPDGTYTVKTLSGEFATGTQVYLTAKKGSESEFEPDRVRELARHFGGLLPYPITVIDGDDSRQVNVEVVPWRRKFRSKKDQKKALLEFGEEALGEKFLDAFPLKAEAGKVEGAAYVLPYSPSLASKKTHRVYLKDMLLSESAEGLLPDWAFFVKCVVNAHDLHPTASRESFRDDEVLEETREALGDCLRDYLADLANREPERFAKLIALHSLSIKSLAVQDDEALKLFADWLPFETSLGLMTLGDYRQKHDVIRYVPNLDQFRQVAGVAAAHELCIINGAYTYDAELLQKLPEVFDDLTVEAIDPSDLTEQFEDLDLDEQEQAYGLVRAADLALQPYRCGGEIKKFLPEDLPALYSTSADANFLRSIEQSKDVADDLWSSVLGNLSGPASTEPYAKLCFNFRNPLVRKIAALREPTLLRRSVEMLYVQALLLGHHPLSGKEMALLNAGLTSLIEWGIAGARKGTDGND